jgi:DNA-damage-inducible protein D
MTSDIITPPINPTFEDFKNQNGHVYWWASDLMKMLDYRDMDTFMKVINKAIKACITLGIDHFDNFKKTERENIGTDYQLSRFACYLTVMNGDPKKEPVASAQVYFVQQTRKFEVYIQNHEEIERLMVREEVKEGNKSLMSTAKDAGLVDYAQFNHKGYLGLYNMGNWQLARRRGIKKDELSEYMGRAELAANLFRITQTEEKIKHLGIKGQSQLEKTHYEVGRQVRGMVYKNTGRTPEQLPTEKRLPDIRKELKKGYKNMLIDDKTKK